MGLTRKQQRRGILTMGMCASLVCATKPYNSKLKINKVYITLRTRTKG